MLQATAKARNASLDILRGGGILLMIIAHVSLPFNLNRIIFSFHMPLFFLLSGYLYKDADIKVLFKKYVSRLLLPYLVTCLIIWLLKSLEGEYNWGWSIIMANGSRPVFGLNQLHVGPLWYLVSFFLSIFIIHSLVSVQK